MAYEAFQAALPPDGTPFTIVAWRRGVGDIRVAGKMGTMPKPKPEPAWARMPATLPGKLVAKTERPAFVQGFISKHPELRALDTRLLSRLLDYEGPKGIIPRRSRLARDLNCGLSALDRALARCKHNGVLRVHSGKAQRKSNRYDVTWPADHKRSLSDDGGSGARPVTSPPTAEARALAKELVKITGPGVNGRLPRDADDIVDGWLARGWRPEIIRNVVCTLMRYQRPSINSLNYFEEPIAKAHEA